MGRKRKREGIHVYIQLIHFTVQHKLPQHYKAILSQLKKKRETKPKKKMSLKKKKM